LLSSFENLFKILAVDDATDTLLLNEGLSINEGSNGHCIAYDNIKMAVDNSSPTYADGELSQYDGSDWANSSATSTSSWWWCRCRGLRMYSSPLRCSRSTHSVWYQS
jgi:hypothetical protein